MTKHTPGPWSVGIDNKRTIISPNDEIVANAFGHTTKRAEANARLIAAAPEMLEVLKRAVANNMLVEGSDWWGDVHAAIAKAEGSQ